MTTIAELLAQHQRSGTGMTSGSPDRCRCGADVYPEEVDYSDPANWPGIKDITVRRDEAFARHQAEALTQVPDDPEPVECEHCCGSGNTKVHVKGATVDAPCTPCGGEGVVERER